MTLLISDICAWFSEQRGATRLDTIVSLLQMSCPLELQFVGVCVEELTRRDQHCLRDVEQRFNLPDMVAKLTDLNDRRCRASLIVAMSLLKASNTSTASAVYKILLSFYVVYQQLPRTKDVVDEIMLLLTMAKHHPAFRFEQKTSISGLFEDMTAFIKQNSHLADNDQGPITTNDHCTDDSREYGSMAIIGKKSTSHTATKPKPRSKSKNSMSSRPVSAKCVATQTSSEDFLVIAAGDRGAVYSVETNRFIDPVETDDEAGLCMLGSLVVNTSGNNSRDMSDVAEDKVVLSSFTIDVQDVLSSSSTKNELDLNSLLLSSTDSPKSDGKCFSASSRIGSSLDALLLTTTTHDHPSATLSSTSSVAAAAAASSDVDCRRSAASSSAEASIRMPVAAAVVPATQLMPLRWQDYVPREIFQILREFNMLHFKKFFAKLSLNELLNLSAENNPQKFETLSPEDQRTILYILDLLRKQMASQQSVTSKSSSRSMLPKNGITASASHVDNLINLVNNSGVEQEPPLSLNQSKSAASINKSYIRAASLPANHELADPRESSPKSMCKTEDSTPTTAVNMLTDSAILAKELAFTSQKQTTPVTQQYYYGQQKPPQQPNHKHQVPVFHSATLPYHHGNQFAHQHGYYNYAGNGNGHNNGNFNSSYRRTNKPQAFHPKRSGVVRNQPNVGNRDDTSLDVQADNKQQWTYNEEDFPPVHIVKDHNLSHDSTRSNNVPHVDVQNTTMVPVNKNSNSLPASKSQSPAPSAETAPPAVTSHTATSYQSNGAPPYHRSPPSMGGAYASATPPTVFKQQQPIRCLMPGAAPKNSPPPPPVAHAGFQSGLSAYAPTLPPPVAYNFQGAAGYPFFAAVLPPPAPFRFVCGPPPMSLPPPQQQQHRLVLCPLCNTVNNVGTACRNCLAVAVACQQPVPLVD